MLYIRCPTCNKVLGNLILGYEENVKKIENNTKLTDIEKEDQKTKVLNDLKLKRECCKVRLMTYLRLDELIL